MAAASLPVNRRKWAIITGGAIAITLRIVLTAIATKLMLIPLLSAAGGLVLIWVAYKLLRLDVNESDDEKKVKEAKNFRQAILLIITADFMMSLDNVIAVAGSAHGSIILLIVGLLLSMPLLMMTGGAISMLIDKFRWLVYAGAFAIVFTAARMMLEDKLIEARFPVAASVVLLAAVSVGMIIPTGFVLFNKWRANRSNDKLKEQGEVDVIAPE